MQIRNWSFCHSPSCINKNSENQAEAAGAGVPFSTEVAGAGCAWSLVQRSCCWLNMIGHDWALYLFLGDNLLGHQECGPCLRSMAKPCDEPRMDWKRGSTSKIFRNQDFSMTSACMCTVMWFHCKAMSCKWSGPGPFWTGPFWTSESFAKIGNLVQLGRPVPVHARPLNWICSQWPNPGSCMPFFSVTFHEHMHMHIIQMHVNSMGRRFS